MTPPPGRKHAHAAVLQLCRAPLGKGVRANVRSKLSRVPGYPRILSAQLAHERNSGRRGRPGGSGGRGRSG
eukprot:8355024-Pyramimonas_sp.AAC.1